MLFWTYMPHCAGGAFYVGSSDDPERRLGEHASGCVPGFTRDRLPVTLVWSEAFASRAEALSAERRIKGWRRAKKLTLIRSDWVAIVGLPRPRTGLRQAQAQRK